MPVLISQSIFKFMVTLRGTLNEQRAILTGWNGDIVQTQVTSSVGIQISCPPTLPATISRRLENSLCAIRVCSENLLTLCRTFLSKPFQISLVEVNSVVCSTLVYCCSIANPLTGKMIMVSIMVIKRDYTNMFTTHCLSNKPYFSSGR